MVADGSARTGDGPEEPPSMGASGVSTALSRPQRIPGHGCTLSLAKCALRRYAPRLLPHSYPLWRSLRHSALTASRSSARLAVTRRFLPKPLRLGHKL